MPLSCFPLLTKLHRDSFHATKRFYHFNHNSHMKSLQRLQSTIEAYNAGIEGIALIDAAILAIEQAEGLVALIRDGNCKARIEKLYRDRAQLLMSLTGLLDKIEKKAARLQGIAQQRASCQALENLLGELLSKRQSSRQAIAAEKFKLMRLSSQSHLLLDKDQFLAYHHYIQQQATPTIRTSYQQLNWFKEAPGDEKLIPVTLNHKSIPVLASLKTLWEQKVSGLARFFFDEKDRLTFAQDHFYRVSLIKSGHKRLKPALRW
jgi:hypothetical protein